jgi:hypothetical protein
MAANASSAAANTATFRFNFSMFSSGNRLKIQRG